MAAGTPGLEHEGGSSNEQPGEELVEGRAEQRHDHLFCLGDNRDESARSLVEVRAEQRQLTARRQATLELIGAEPNRVVPGGHRFLLDALVVRPEDAGAHKPTSPAPASC